MLIIGLTGGIGSGKSEAARILERLGAVVVNADLAGHEAYRPGSQTWQAVVEAFGKGVVAPSGEIDRKLLGAKVFSDPAQIRRLSEIVWPEIRRILKARIEAERQAGRANAVVIEAAVLLEAGWDDLVDEVWVVDSPESLALQRLKAKGISPDQASARMRSQFAPEARRARADVVLRNDADLLALEAAVRSAWNGRVESKA
ncbi:MAG: dephospho-CoA kinase [Chloroflexi bacterium]|nr:dephospho-CoA kinase [Chloroflexota bacterium]